MKKFTTTLVLLLINLFLIINLSACGFKLRGAVDLPPQLHTIYFESSVPYNRFTRQLTASLEFSGVKIVDSANQAPITFCLQSERITSPQTSVGSSQLTRNYRVNYTVKYVLKDAKGNIIYTPSEVTEQKTITLNPQEVLENSNKLGDSKQLMRESIIHKILLQLSSKDVSNTLAKIQPYHEDSNKPTK